MKKLKKYIIILIVIILLLFIWILALKQDNQGNTEISKQTESIEDTSEEHLDWMEHINQKGEYLQITNSLTQFISELNINKSSYYGRDEKNNYTRVVSEDIINQNIYNILSEEYINRNNIEVSNVRNFTYKIEEMCYYIPVEIYIKSNLENVKTYGIYGVIENMGYNPIMESYIILNIDENNQTFSVEILDSLEELKNKSVQSINNISNKGNNIYSNLVGIMDEKLIQEYINVYKRLVLGYPEIVYNNYLDTEYKEKKFGTLEKFKEYVKNNKGEIQSIVLKEYTTVEESEYTQYIGIDKDGKYYIFNTGKTFDYKILLDNYTVDIPHFTRKYEKSNSIEKCEYNIQKCIEAINNKDYLYVYNKLDNEFKTNNYKTEKDFENIIKKKLFDTNKITNSSCSNEGNIYIYSLNISDTENEADKQDMTIIMQLLEGTDFVISFSFK